MSKIFFTADQHFGHANILKYEASKRVDANGHPFANVDIMNDYLIDQWNAVVGDTDLVYCLGDFSLKSEIAAEILPFLNGEKILLMGNHDPHFKGMVAGKDVPSISGFSAVYQHLDIVLDGVGVVRLSHFPYRPGNHKGLPAHDLRYPDQRPRKGREVALLHGHVHSRWLVQKEVNSALMINVGVEMWQLRPVAAIEIVELILTSSA